MIQNSNLFKREQVYNGMTKKCIICDEIATFKIKDTPDYYCQTCAEENFADLTVLMKVEEEAQKLKAYVKEKVAGGEDSVSDDADRED